MDDASFDPQWFADGEEDDSDSVTLVPVRKAPRRATATAGRAPVRAPTDRAAGPDDASDSEGPDAADHIDALSAYQRDVGGTSLLSASEEVELGRLVQRGDSAARARMIESNLRLVIMMARRYMNRGLPLDDLIEEGNLGLIRAVEKFDPELGYRFSTYAGWWIRQAVERALANQSRLIRLPVHVTKAISSCHRAIRVLTQQLGRTPDAAEVAAQCNMTVAEVRDLLNVHQEAEAADRAAERSEGFADEAVADPRPADPETLLLEREMRDRLEASLEGLDARQQEVICRRFGLRGHEPQTLEQVGAAVSLARERVRQIQLQALARLRTALTERVAVADGTTDEDEPRTAPAAGPRLVERRVGERRSIKRYTERRRAWRG